MELVKAECAKCGIKNKICRSPEGQGPAFCPTAGRTDTHIADSPSEINSIIVTVVFAFAVCIFLLLGSIS